jgi:hypothetical protein
MKISAAIVVGILGVIVAIAGGVSLFQFGVAADASGTSGWNPWLWLVLIAGVVLTVFAAVQAIGSVSRRDNRD